jgi:uncharacterized membrane protein
MSELIKMSKMNVDDFDTYVTSKGFSFYKQTDETNIQSVEYALNLESSTLRAEKFITLFQRYFESRFNLNYQTLDKKEYLNIKNQLKALGFIFKDQFVFKKVDGSEKNVFEYRKGKAKILIFAGDKSFEINYEVNY